MREELATARWLPAQRHAEVVGPHGEDDEIALPGDPIPPGGIVSSNAHALAALVRACGGDPLVLPIAPDDSRAIAEAATAARACDLLVTTGGASVGDHDLVQSALGPEDFALDFWKIAMRPGKPLIWGRLGMTPVLGLPGNPVSALVCGVIFLVPALQRLCGLPGEAPRTVRALAGAPLPANDRRYDHLRARLETDADGNLIATPFALQDSSMLKTLARAEGLVLRPPNAPALAAGEPLDVIPLGELGI